MAFKTGDKVQVKGTPHDPFAAGETYTVSEVREGQTVYAMQAADGTILRWGTEDEIKAAEGGTAQAIRRFSTELERAGRYNR